MSQREKVNADNPGPKAVSLHKALVESTGNDQRCYATWVVEVFGPDEDNGWRTRATVMSPDDVCQRAFSGNEEFRLSVGQLLNEVGRYLIPRVRWGEASDLDDTDEEDRVLRGFAGGRLTATRGAVVEHEMDDEYQVDWVLLGSRVQPVTPPIFYDDVVQDALRTVGTGMAELTMIALSHYLTREVEAIRRALDEEVFGADGDREGREGRKGRKGRDDPSPASDPAPLVERERKRGDA